MMGVFPPGPILAELVELGVGFVVMLREILVSASGQKGAGGIVMAGNDLKSPPLDLLLRPCQFGEEGIMTGYSKRLLPSK